VKSPAIFTTNKLIPFSCKFILKYRDLLRIVYAGVVDLSYTPATLHIRSVFAGGFASVLPVLFSESAVSCGRRSRSVSCCQYIALCGPSVNDGRTSSEHVPAQ